MFIVPFKAASGKFEQLIFAALAEANAFAFDHGSFVYSTADRTVIIDHFTGADHRSLSVKGI